MTVQPNQTLDTVNGILSLRQAITQIGTSDFLNVYNTASSLSGIITDATGAVIVPKFTIATVPTSPNSIFSNIAAATTPTGNADVAYTIFNPDGQSVRDVAVMTQISPTGSILVQPTFVDSSNTDSQTQAAIAVAPTGAVAITFTDSSALGSANTNIFARVFNSSLVPLAPSQQLTVTNTNNSVFQNRANSTVVYNGGDFDIAWYQQTYTPQFATAAQEIDGNSLTPAGDFNGDGTPDLLVTGNTHDTLGQPYLLSNPTGLTLFYAVQAFTPSPSFTFGGTTIFDQALSNSLTTVGSPNTLITTVPNAENVIGSVACINDSTGTGSTDVVFCDSGQNGGSGLSGDSARVLTFHTTTGGQTCTLTSDTSTTLPSGVTDPLGAFAPANNGTVSGTFAAAAPTGASQTDDFIDVPIDFDPSGQSTTDPVDNPSFRITYDLLSASNEVEFHIHLNNAGAFPSSVHYATRDGTLLSDFNYDEASDTATLSADDDDYLVLVKLRYTPFLVATPENFFVDLSSPTNAIIQSGDGTAEAVIEGSVAPGGTTDPGITKTESFTSRKVLVVTGNNGLPTTLSLKGPGTAKLVLNGSGAVDLLLTGTTAQTQLTIKGDTYTLRNFTCNTPLGKISAPHVNIAGNITTSGCNSIALGNVKDNHIIKLGKLTNAVITFAQVANSNLTATGSIKSLTVADWAGGSITVPLITTLTSSHDLDADLSVTSITKLSVVAALGGTSPTDVRHLRATQSFGTITAGQFVAANISAGLKSTLKTLPTSRAQFLSSTASIKSLSTTGSFPAFIDSIIAAPIITTFHITGLDPTNPTPFGLAAERITTYQRDQVSKKNIFSKKHIDSTAQYLAATL
ncbi:MAG TPA: integrin alpha [Tepidisphaeraceae bacterium]|nr:integrin alpha [Tepidisphaeraceae bacterium]